MGCGSSTARERERLERALALAQYSMDEIVVSGNTNVSTSVSGGAVSIAEPVDDDELDDTNTGEFGVAEAVGLTDNVENEDSAVRELREQLDRLKRKQVFLESLREALLEVQNEEQTEDPLSGEGDDVGDEGEDEDEYDLTDDDDDEEEKREPEKPRHKSLYRAERFIIEKPKNEDEDESDSSDDGEDDEEADLELLNLISLEGEGSRAWNNRFAGQLALLRRFYSWDEIPMDFFVDKHVSDNRRGSKVRSRLSSRLSARRSLRLDETRATLPRNGAGALKSNENDDDENSTSNDGKDGKRKSKDRRRRRSRDRRKD